MKIVPLYNPIPVRRKIRPISHVTEPFFSGEGFFAGSITRQNRPMGGVIVQLIHSETGTVARTTTSEVDGTFVFDNIAEGHEYHIIAIDPEGEWEHKVSSRRYPRTTL